MRILESGMPYEIQRILKANNPDGYKVNVIRQLDLFEITKEQAIDAYKRDNKFWFAAKNDKFYFTYKNCLYQVQCREIDGVILDIDDDIDLKNKVSKFTFMNIVKKVGNECKYFISYNDRYKDSLSNVEDNYSQLLFNQVYKAQESTSMWLSGEEIRIKLTSNFFKILAQAFEKFYSEEELISNKYVLIFFTQFTVSQRPYNIIPRNYSDFIKIKSEKDKQINKFLLDAATDLKDHCLNINQLSSIISSFSVFNEDWAKMIKKCLVWTKQEFIDYVNFKLLNKYEARTAVIKKLKDELEREITRTRNNAGITPENRILNMKEVGNRLNFFNEELDVVKSELKDFDKDTKIKIDWLLKDIDIINEEIETLRGELYET